MSESLAPHLSVAIDVPADGGLSETAHKNRAILAAAYDALVAGNAAALFDILDPDVRFYEAPSLPYAAEAKGLADTAAGVEKMLSYWQRMDCRITEYLAGGDMVIAYVDLHAEGPGGSFDGPVAELFRFRSGKVIEWRPIYFDTARIVQILDAPQ